MKHMWIAAVAFAAFALTSAAFAEEQISTTAGETTTPRLIKFNGTLKDPSGFPRAGQVVINFALYSSQEGGEALWRERQLVKLDEEGRYMIFLGASEKEGLPLQLFSTEKAQWLGVQPEGEAEQARAVLVAVPYALKAADADSVGGEPMSSFVLNKDWLQAGGDFNAYTAILQQRGIIGSNGKLAAQNGASLTKFAFRDGGGIVISNGLEGATNTFYGQSAGTSTTTGFANSFFGSNTGRSNTTGTFNSFFGSEAGYNNTTGTTNSFFGNYTGRSNTTGGANSFFGNYAGYANTTGNNNSFFGQQAGNANTTGGSNSFFGSYAGQSNTTGLSNSFFGSSAGVFNTTGGSNSFFGNYTGYANTWGVWNSFFGSYAGQSNTTGDSNSFFGQQAGNANTTGSGNSIFGQGAGLFNTTGSGNSFFGRSAGHSNTTGDTNSFFGTGAGYYNTTGGSNSFFGQQAGYANTTGFANSFFGGGAGYFNTGNNNSFFGSYAGYANTTGVANSFFGSSAGYANTTGFTNSFFGQQAGYANTTGFANSFFGNYAGNANTTGGFNSFFGNYAGYANTGGGSNSFFGQQAGYANTTGGSNSFFGNYAGGSNTTGFSNSFFGDFAGYANNTGGFNSFFGQQAGYANTTGGSNSFFGSYAGQFNTTGLSNSFFGNSAGHSNTVEDNNSFIGAATDGAAGITNTTAIGYRAQVTQSNSLVLGSINGVNSATADTNVGIGTTAPQAKLHVEGNAYFNGNVSFGTVNSYAKLTFQNDSTVSDPIAMIDTAPGGRSWRFGGGVGGAGLFTIRDDTAGANRFSIRSDGNIGIGTTNAYAKLTFAYDSTVADPIAMIDTAPGGRTWRFGGGVGAAGTFTIRDDTAAANRLTIASDGNVGIGTTNPTEKLQVVGNIKVSGTILYGAAAAEEVPDYVFEPGYALMPVQELENYLASEKHLPSVPSAAEIKQNGLNLSEFQMKLLRKIEELTLYIVQQAKANDLQAKAINKKDEEISAMKSNYDARLSALEQLLSKEGHR